MASSQTASGLRFECYNGPLDGARPTCSLAAEFIWTNGNQSFKEPGPKRHLYRKARGRRGTVLLYAGHAVALCACGAYHSKLTDSCTLCGASLTS